VNAPLLVVTGTGTGIGKTHVTGALLLAWTRALREAGVADPKVAGLKPVETGVSGTGGEGDGGTLERLSTFHVKRFPPPYLLARAVSPHLAAREAGITVELSRVVRHVVEVRAAGPDGVAVELAGGLFSPLAPSLSNADVARALAADVALLVAPDRLGVLHEVAATTRAAAGAGVTLTGIVLVAPETPDASTGTNAAELALVTDLPVLAVVPRGEMSVLAERPDLTSLVRALVRAPGRGALPL
jgi:dethiobiotin synthetase